MKRGNLNNFSTSGSSSSSPSSMDKGKMWECEMEEPGIDDELFGVLGYKVKSSDMAEVAHKIQQIEVAMGNAAIDGYSQFPAAMDDTFHYNPSDLSSWLEGMLSGLNPLPEFDSSFDSFLESATGGLAVDDLDFGSDLVAIPGKAVFANIQFHQPSPENRNQHQPPSKKAKTSPSMGDFISLVESSPAPRSILIDSQENGIRLVHTLMACAEAVQQENFKLAEALVKNVGFLAVSQAGAMRKVATYFAEALARRIYRLYPVNHHPQDLAFTDMLQMHFYETCPYLKFAHFTANQAILEAFAGKKHVHVIDFSMKQGMQWPALLQALALRQGGPPTFRLTGIGPPSPEDTDYLQEVGFRLAQFAKAINVQFEYRGFVANSLADLDSSLLDIREDETIAVNSIFELHQLLANPGAIDKVLRIIREMKPDILTVVEQEANHNSNFFLDRFTEALHYYSTLFDSLETCDGGGGADEAISRKNKMISEVYLGQQILNVVACEGVDRVERHESLTQWRNRFNSAGFEPVHLGSNVYKQAIMLLAVFDGDGYSVDENDGCLMLGWQARPLIATSAWTMSDGYGERWNRRKYVQRRHAPMSES